MLTRRTAVLFGLTALSGACSTQHYSIFSPLHPIPLTFEFDPTSQTETLLIAPALPVNGPQVTFLEEVDPSTYRKLGHRWAFGFNPGALLTLPPGSGPMRFAALRIKPGFYAAESGQTAGYPYSSYWYFEDNAPVFNLKAGVINVAIDFMSALAGTPPAVQTEEVLAGARELLQHYPNVSGDLSPVDIVARIELR